MSRIEQALRQAGAPILQGGGAADTALDFFPPAAEHPRPSAEREPAARPAPPEVRTSQALVACEQSPRICGEQFQNLAAVLDRRQRDVGGRLLLVASAYAGEGKTFTAANLGFTLTQSYGRRVLLVDADMRRPSLHTMFDVAASQGLADTLRGRIPHVPVVSLSENLALLPAGTPEADPMPMLSSGRVGPIVLDVAAAFDWVIIDVPPVALLPDAAVLSPIADTAVFIISAGVAPYRLVQRAIETVGREKIAGVILNRIERNAVPEAGYDRYYGRGDGSRPRVFR